MSLLSKDPLTRRRTNFIIRSLVVLHTTAYSLTLTSERTSPHHRSPQIYECIFGFARLYVLALLKPVLCVDRYAVKRAFFRMQRIASAPSLASNIQVHFRLRSVLHSPLGELSYQFYNFFCRIYFKLSSIYVIIIFEVNSNCHLGVFMFTAYVCPQCGGKLEKTEDNK